MNKIAPAMSAGEWERGGLAGPPGSWLENCEWEGPSTHRGQVGVTTEGGAAFYGLDDGERHALAALCLHRQSFGFTWEDVEAIRRVAAAHFPPDFYDYNHLANRVEALLPPQELS